jgi:PAS domain-containing protein
MNMIDQHSVNAQAELREGKSGKQIPILDSSEDAIIGKDLDGIVTTWKKGAKHIYGYTA